jgi:transposase
VAAEVYYGDYGDTLTLEDTVQMAQTNLRESGSDVQVQDVVADKGYHSAEVLTEIAGQTPYRTYVAEPALPAGRTHTWTDKPTEQHDAVNANRRRARGQRGKKLQRQRSEKVERSFAHVCETGGARRTWLRGIEKVYKRYLMSAMAHNLGRLMRGLFGMGTPRGLQKFVDELAGLFCPTYSSQTAVWSLLEALGTRAGRERTFFGTGRLRALTVAA